MPRGSKLNKNDLSRKRRRKKNFKVYFLAAVFLFVVVGLVVLARLPSFQIKSVKVLDAKRISASAVEEVVQEKISGYYLWIFPKKNFMIYPKKSVKAGIMEAFPAVLEVEVSTELDRQLYIKVKERLATSLWCSSSASCYYLDEEGVVFARALSPENGFLKYFGLIKQDGSDSLLGKEYGGKEFFVKLNEFVVKVESLGFKASSIEVIDDTRAQVNFTDNSYLIFLPYEKDRDKIFDYLETFLDDLKTKNGGNIPSLEYIDARYGNKIFYKMREDAL